MNRSIDLNSGVVVITGGTGSWGTVLVDRLLRDHEPKAIRVVSRGEVQQVEMAYRVQHPSVSFHLGDVRDAARMDDITRGADIVYHLAALKHVPVCERNPKEAVATNVHGAQVMLDACRKNGVPHFVYVSTDKAVEPINIYGVTKACAERVAVAASSDEMKVTCVRAGNVMGSSGSVIPLFLKQIMADGEVRITDPEMTRFMLPLPLVIDFLIQATHRSVGGEIQVTRAPAMRVLDLARVLIDDYFAMLPHEPSDELLRAYGDLPPLDLPEYTSGNAVALSKQDIRELLTEYGLISLSGEAARLELATRGAWIDPPTSQ